MKYNVPIDLLAVQLVEDTVQDGGIIAVSRSRGLPLQAKLVLSAVLSTDNDRLWDELNEGDLVYFVPGNEITLTLPELGDVIILQRRQVILFVSQEDPEEEVTANA